MPAFADARQRVAVVVDFQDRVDFAKPVGCSSLYVKIPIVVGAPGSDFVVITNIFIHNANANVLNLLGVGGTGESADHVDSIGTCERNRYHHKCKQ